MNILLRRVRNDQNHGNGPAAVNHFRIPNNILCHPRWTQVSTIDLNHKLLHPISFDKHAKVVPWCLVDLHKGLASSKIIRLNIGLGLGHSLISTTTISSLTSSELPGLQDTSASSTSLCATLPPTHSSPSTSPCQLSFLHFSCSSSSCFLEPHSILECLLVLLLTFALLLFTTSLLCFPSPLTHHLSLLSCPFFIFLGPLCFSFSCLLLCHQLMAILLVSISPLLENPLFENLLHSCSPLLLH